MTGRRLYEIYCDTTEHVGCIPFLRDKTTLAHPDKPPVAWAYLLRRDRDVWNALARRITPKRKPKPPTAPVPARVQSVYLRYLGERKIQAIKEFRPFSGFGLRESKAVVDHASTAPYRLALAGPVLGGKSFDDVVRELPEMEVTAGA